MKTVLIIAHECVPYNRPGSVIGSQRPFQFAKYLKEFGWRAIVICRDFKLEGRAINNWKSQVDQNINKALLKSSSELFIALPSLPFANQVDRMWRNAVIMDDKKGTFLSHPGFFNSLKRKWATFLKLRTGDYSENWIEVAYYACQKLNSETKIDLLVAEHGPNASLFVASKIHKQFNIPWVIDFRDPIDRDFKPLQRKIFNLWTLPSIRSCARVINVNPYWTSLEMKRFNAKGITLFNGFDEAEFAESVQFAEQLSELKIGYFGTIQKPQDITPFIEALALIKEKEDIRFIYRGNSVAQVQQIVNGLNLPTSICELAGQVPREEILKLYQRCDILLLLSLQDDNDIYFKQGLHPGKTFEYFGANKPILVVPGDNGMLDALILANHSGMVGRTSQEIAQLLQQALVNKKQGLKIFDFNPTFEEIQFFTRKNQTRLLAELLDDVVRESKNCLKTKSIDQN